MDPTLEKSFNRHWIRCQTAKRFSDFTAEYVVSTIVCFLAPLAMDPSLVIVHDLDGIEIIPEEPTEKTISWIEDILQSDYSQANILSFCPIASAVAETLLTGRGLQSQARELLVTIQKEREETNRTTSDIVFLGCGIGLLIVKQALAVADLDQQFQDIIHRATHVGFLEPHQPTESAQTWEKTTLEMALQLNNLYGWSIAATLNYLSLAVPEIEWAFLEVSRVYEKLIYEENFNFRAYESSKGLNLDAWQKLSDKLRPLAASASFSPSLDDAYNVTISRFSLSHFQYGLSRTSTSNAFRQLLSAKVYLEWKDTKKPSILSLHGTNGIGKTAIAQGVAINLISGGNTGVVVYFSFGNIDIMRRSTASLLKAIIFKVLSTTPATWDRIRSQSAWIQRFHHLTIEELCVIVRLLWSSNWISRVICIIDDIDKCTDDLILHLKALMQLGDGSGVQFNIVTTSESALVSMDPWSTWTINLDLPIWKEKDICRAVTSTMQEVLRHNHGLAELERSIIDELKHCNSPMEVGIRLEALSHCARPLTFASAQKNISILQKPLRELYAQLLGQVEELDPWARAALSWMSLSFRPLNLHELSIAINHGPEMTERREFEQSLLLDLGGELKRALGVLIDLRDETANFPHQSMKEYVQDLMTNEKNQGTATPVCGVFTHGDLARRCLAYLRLFNLDSGPPTTGYKTFLRSNNLDFTTYAAMHWTSHYIAHEDRKSLVQDVLAFFALEKARTQWAKWWRAQQQMPEIDDLPMTPIALSAQHGLLEVTKQLILQSEDGQISLEERLQALEITLNFGHLDVARELLHSTSPSAKAISLTARLGDLALLQEMMANADKSHSYAVDCLENAAFRGHLEVVNTLLRCLQDVPTFLKDNPSAYLRSVEGGQLHILRRLLDAGPAQLSMETGTTLVHLSAWAGDLHMISLLQEYGVDINGTNEDGETLMCHAVVAGHAKVAAELGRKVKTWGADRDGNSPLHIAASQGNFTVFKELMKFEPELKATNNQGDQSIHIAAMRGHVEIVLQLLRKGLDPTLANRSKFDLLHLAAQNGHLAMVKYLLGKDSGLTTDTGSPQKCDEVYTEEARPEAGSDSDTEPHDKAEQSDNIQDGTKSGDVQETDEIQEEVEEEDDDLQEEEGEEDEEEVVVSEEDGGFAYEPTPLHSASSRGYLEIIKTLLPHANDSLGNNSGGTPLHLAVQGGHTAAVRYLLMKGSNLEVCDNHGRLPIHLACEQGNPYILQALLQNRSSIETTDDEGNTALHISTENGHEQLVQYLLDAKADPNLEQRNFGGSALHIAARLGHVGISKLLVKAGVETAKQDKEGRTALHVALIHFQREIASFLLDCGADPHTQDTKGQTPFSCAVINHMAFETVERLLPAPDRIMQMIEKYPLLIHKTICASSDQRQRQRMLGLLLRSGWNPLVKDENGYTSLKLALEEDLTLEAEQLLDRINLETPSITEYSESLIDLATEGFVAGVRKVLAYSDVSLEIKGGPYGQTPLAIAAENGKDDVVKLLLEKGADVNARDNDNMTPFVVAFFGGHKDIAIQLIDAKADLDGETPNGNTCLDLAVSEKDMKFVRLLLENGASVTKSEGRRPVGILRMSVQQGNLEITTILLSHGASPFEVDDEGLTATHDAVQADDPAMLETLLQNAIKHVPEVFDWTPLHLAAMMGDVELIKAHATLIDVKDTRGRTPLHWASLRGHLEAVNTLCNMQTDLQAQDEDGMTALHLAITGENTEIVKALADKSDLSTVRDLDGWSPIYYARSLGHEDIVSVLSGVSSIADNSLALPRIEWANTSKVEGVIVKDDGRTIITENVDHTYLDERVQVRTKHPMAGTEPLYYYEISITRSSPERIMGLGFCGKNSDPIGMPGWRSEAWGYHADDGCLFAETGTGKPLGPRYYTGDVVGCGVDFVARTIFFTHNGNFVGKSKADCKGKFYPVFGFGENGVEITTNFGQDEFQFKGLEGFAWREK